MQPPTGMDLHPTMPLVTRLKKRPGWIVAGVLFIVLALVCYRIYERPKELAHSGILTDEKKRVEPATRAGEEITKDIPVGVVNLAGETKKTEGDSTRPGAQPPKNPPRSDLREPFDPSSHRANPVLVPPPSATVYPPVAAYPPLYQPPTTAEPRKSSADERLAAAYERELQAMASPTSIQAENGGSSTSPSFGTPSTMPSSNDLSAINAFTNALRGTTASVPPRERQTLIGNSELDDQNLQTRKEAFLAAARRSTPADYLKSTRTMPLSKYEIKTGWEIPAVLEQEINSDLPGELKALVTANVYDTATGNYLLIPQGSRLIGTYDSAVGYGQKRLQVVWNRIIFPDASWVDLGGMLGQDAHGSAGFSHDVDNHYKRLIGFAVLSSVFSAGFQLSQTQRTSVLQTPSAGEIAASAVGQEVSQLGTEITRRNLNVQPTIKAPIGYRFNVRVNRDILFESPYEPTTPIQTKNQY
jgi:type IV secretion system protein VirB10